MWKNKLWKNFENRGRKIRPTVPVEKFWNSTQGLWRKKRWSSKGNATFPHKFLLLLRLLPNLLIHIYIFIYSGKKGFYYALYL